MEQFNLEKYLKNPARKVVTRDGRKVRILCTDFNNKTYPIVGEIQCMVTPEIFTEEGLVYKGSSDMNDLFFAPEKRIGWINLFKGDCVDAEAYLGESRIYSSKEIAEREGRSYSNYLSTIKIEWEE